jgi:hypothetical protein
MPRAKDSNTKVYKVRKDVVDMFVGYMLASCLFTNESDTADIDMDIYKENAIAEFKLTDVETAIAIQAFANYLSKKTELN